MIPGHLADMFITLDISTALQVVALGFVGGVLSGFIGSGGAFFMTPGMMNLGVSGVVAVGSNITHKFGKALMGSKKHGEMGNVDKKLGLYLLATAAAGIRLAVVINSMLIEGGAGKGAPKSAAGDLYISAVFVSVLSIVAILILRDVFAGSDEEDAGPSRLIIDFLGKLNLRPIIHFPVADVKVSLWVLLIVGLATGYLAGTIGVGGFLGVPAMIYVFGVPTAVAAGTELFLAMFMGAFGALNYAYEGFVDIRLTLLLYGGSLVGIYLGAYGTKVVKEVMIRIVTGVIILLCVLSRLIAIPVYMSELHWLQVPAWVIPHLNSASKALLFASGGVGTAVILYQVFKAYWQRGKVQKSLFAAAGN